MPHREAIEWCDLWITGAAGSPLPRVLLIGDSITRGYYETVDRGLQGRAQCARIATSKFVGDPGFARELALLLDDYAFSVIHVNNGLHGWDYTEAAYGTAVAALLQDLRTRFPATRLIWAQTTPVRDKAQLAALDPQTDRVRERNRLAAAAATAQGLPVNDLFAAVIDRPELFAADGVHYTAAGSAALGAQVLNAISALLPAK